MLVVVPVQGLIVAAVLVLLADLKPLCALLIALLLALVLPLLLLFAPQLFKRHACVNGFEL